METIVYGGAQGGASLIEEVEWKPLYGGARGWGKFSIKKPKGDHCMVEQ